MDLVNCSRCGMLYFVCWGVVCLNLSFPLWYPRSVFLVQLLLVLLDVCLFVSRSVCQCSGFCSIWLLKYFAVEVEMVGCSKLVMFGS